MADPYLGEIRMFGGNFAISGWALCNGQLLSIAQNSALFSILGTYYGGDGIQTFGLPDFRGRAPVHQGQGNGLTPYTIGESTGAQSVTLTMQQLPVHTHQYTPQANNGGGAGSRPSGGYLANSGGTSLYATATDGTAMGAQTLGQAGGSQPFNIIQPSLCITFLIALRGIYPSRN
jgi:microcystin-dependent protein